MAIKTQFKQTEWAKRTKQKLQNLGLLGKKAVKTTVKKANKVTTGVQKEYKQKKRGLNEFIRYSSRKIQGKRTYAKKSKR